MFRRGLLVSLAAGATLFGGCADEREDSAGPARDVDPQELAGVYAGTFPCSNCPGIDTRLWLRGDGTYFLRQRYLQEDGGSAAPHYSLGRWHWDRRSALLVTRAPGPQRRFTVGSPGRLHLQTDTGLEHALDHDPAGKKFAESLRLEGEYALAGSQALFTECSTRLRFLIAETGQHRRLRQHYRSLTPRGEPALASIVGRMELDDAGDGNLLQVEELLTVKPGAGCPPLNGRTSG